MIYITQYKLLEKNIIMASLQFEVLSSKTSLFFLPNAHFWKIKYGTFLIFFPSTNYKVISQFQRTAFCNCLIFETQTPYKTTQFQTVSAN